MKAGKKVKSLLALNRLSDHFETRSNFSYGSIQEVDKSKKHKHKDAERRLSDPIELQGVKDKVVNKRPTTKKQYKKLLEVEETFNRKNGIEEVEIRVGYNGLGLIIDGGIENMRDPNIYVQGFKRDSIAERNGKVRLGDRLLQINGTDVQNVSKKTVVMVLSSFETPSRDEVSRVVRLCLQRKEWTAAYLNEYYHGNHGKHNEKNLYFPASAKMFSSV